MRNTFEKDFNSIFNSFESIFNNPTIRTYNKVETDDVIILDIVAPGLKSEDFKLEYKNFYLNITIPEQRGLKYKLPLGSDVGNITADYVAGILKIKIPKLYPEDRVIKVSQ